MNKNKMFIIISILVICLTGCEYQYSTTSSARYHLPTNAINVRNLGNGWVTFELDDRLFIYHKLVKGNAGFECITEIDK